MVRAPVGGGPAAKVADYGKQYSSFHYGDIAVAAGKLYWGTRFFGIATAATTGGTADVFVACQPQGIAVDPSFLYWADEAGWVFKVPFAGGPPTLLATGSPSPGAVVVDATSIYWASTAGVMKLAK